MRFLLFLPILLFAGVSVSVNKTHLNIGEELIITINASGQNIRFPNPTSIDGYKILGTSVSNNIVAINGNIQESVSKSFIIAPDKNITIPSFNVEVDGKIYKTKPIKIIVQVPKQTLGDYVLDLNLSKEKVYLGEPVILTLKFTEKKEADTINLQKPYINNSVVKLIKQIPLNNGMEYKFLVLPQKVGTYEVGPFIANVGKKVIENPFNDPFFNLGITEIKYKRIYSNHLTLKVMPIPFGAVYGNFKIKVDIAKNKVKADEPNKIRLKISGCGDFYDLPNFNLNIPNATVYSSKGILKTYVNNSKLCGVFEKNFTVIAESNYTITPFELKEFNGTLNIVKTKEINVSVFGNIAKHKEKKVAPNIVKTKEKAHKQKSGNYLLYIAIFGSGIVIGSLLVYFFVREDEFKKIKKASQKELFNLLIPYGDDERIKEILKKLEENIYKGANHKIDRKEIIKILKKKK